MNKRVTIFVCLIFLLSRIPFINIGPIFFDSAAYIKAFTYPTLLEAVTSVHFPLHDGYILLFWPVYQLAQILSIPPLYAVIVGQIILAFAIVILYYLFVRFLTDERTALISAFLISLTPLFWISNVTILYEISYVGLFFASLFFLMHYLKKKKERYIHFSAIFLIASLFTHMMVALWIPFYLAIVFFNARKKLLRIALIIGMYFFLLAIARTCIIAFATGNSLQFVFEHLYFGNYANAQKSAFDIKTLLVSIRNFIIPLMRGYTILITILGFLSLGILFLKNKKLFIYGVLWIAPAFIALQFWEAQLPGRYGILAGFGLTFAAAYLIRQKKVIIFLVILYMLIASIPALNLLRSDIPYLKLAAYTATLPKNSLLIDSHFSRRQIEDFYKGELLSVNQPGMGREKIKATIDTYLRDKKDVFVSSPALTDPYGLYTGPYLHILSLSYSQPPELGSVLTDYTLTKYKVINEDDGIIMYKIVSAQKNPYPQIKSLKHHYRRIDNTDPLWVVYQKAENIFIK